MTFQADAVAGAVRQAVLRSRRKFVDFLLSEVLKSLDRPSQEELEEELGDVLFQVVFHSVLASEEGQFALSDVARNVHDKLVGRHPHVFGDERSPTPQAVEGLWERIKAQEKSEKAARKGAVEQGALGQVRSARGRARTGAGGMT